MQSRDQKELRLLSVDPATGQTAVLRADTDPVWTDIVPGVPAWTAAGAIAWTADVGTTRRLLVAAPGDLAGAEPVTPDGLQVREVLDVDGDTVLFSASAGDPTQVGLWRAGPDGLTELPLGEGVHGGRQAGGTTVAVSRRLSHGGAEVTVLRDGAASASPPWPSGPCCPSRGPSCWPGPRGTQIAVLLPSWHEPGAGPLPVLCDPYGGPHAQRVLATRDAYWTSQWLAEQGFAVVIADGRGTPGQGPGFERAVAGDLAGPVLADQVDALHAAAQQCGDLDLTRVGIRGWSFGGYLAALAVLRAPEVFHAAVAGAPVTDWQLYDTHYTERYLGLPADSRGRLRAELADQRGREPDPAAHAHPRAGRRQRGGGPLAAAVVGAAGRRAAAHGPAADRGDPHGVPGGGGREPAAAPGRLPPGRPARPGSARPRAARHCNGHCCESHTPCGSRRARQVIFKGIPGTDLPGRSRLTMTQASVAPGKTRAQISEKTLRKDPWWRAPAITATLLTIWVAYATTHVFIGKWYSGPAVPLPDPVLLAVRQRGVHAGGGEPGYLVRQGSRRSSRMRWCRCPSSWASG